jgi:hypothetical protein
MAKVAPGVRLWDEAAKKLGYNIADPNGPQSISQSHIIMKQEYSKF